jgi:hypothetical protein
MVIGKPSLPTRLSIVRDIERYERRRECLSIKFETEARFVYSNR